jgi:autotransporter-associated beta strand protein
VNSYSGGTQVTDGVLIVTGSGTLGAAGGSVAVSGLGQLDLRNQQVLTGTISMTGQDARILSGDSGNPGSIVNNGVAFQFGGGLLSVPVSGSAGMNVTGGGVISGSNSYAGPTTISATPGWYGTNALFVGNANALGTAAGDLAISGGVVNLQNNTVTRSGSLAITGGVVLSGTFDKSGAAYDLQGGEISAVLAGVAGLTKSGTGVAVLSGNNSYSGATAVDAGGLLVNGVQSGSGLVSVANGGRIGGDGSLAGGLTLASGANFIFNPLTTFDVSGAVTLPNSFGVANLVNADNSSIDWGSIADGTYTLIGTTESTFGNITNFGPGNAYDLGGGRSAYFQNGSLELVVVPEPSSLAMLGCVVACGGLLLRRRRASVAR